MARRGTAGEAWRGEAWRGSAWQAGHGKCGLVGGDMAEMATITHTIRWADNAARLQRNIETSNRMLARLLRSVNKKTEEAEDTTTQGPHATRA